MAPATAQRTRRIPAPALVVAATTSAQVGGAFAKTLFGNLGPGGTAFLRVGFAAVILLAAWRPRLNGHTRRELALAAAFGIALAGMNLSFYEALDRIPLGIAVTIEFTGPLAVAVAGSRRPLDVVWVVLAAAGVALLARPGGVTSAAGIAFALAAGACWATYIVLSARVGRAFPGGKGLAIAMAVGALCLVPVGVASAGWRLADPANLWAAAGVALLSSVIPYSLELEALRRLPKRVFGIFMSLDPAMAAIAGLIVLGEALSASEVVAVGLVVAASTGAAAAGRTPRQPPLDA